MDASATETFFWNAGLLDRSRVRDRPVKPATKATVHAIATRKELCVKPMVSIGTKCPTPVRFANAGRCAHQDDRSAKRVCFQVGITLAHAIWRLVKAAGSSDGSRDRVDCQRWIFTAQGPCAQLIWCNGRRRNQTQLSDRSSKFWHLRIWAQSRHSTKAARTDRALSHCLGRMAGPVTSGAFPSRRQRTSRATHRTRPSPQFRP